MTCNCDAQSKRLAILAAGHSGGWADSDLDGAGQRIKRIEFTSEIALCLKHKPENPFSPPKIRRDASTRWL
jgi:hypothetical protein